MRDGKYQLYDLLEIGRLQLFQTKRELLVAPIGSGKTYMVMHKSKDFNNVLYLCDTKALLEQVNNDLITYNVDNVTPMTYSSLYQKTVMDFKDQYIQQYDLIICDEIHSLIKFSSYGAELKYVVRLMFSDEIEYHGNILMMTATPEYIENLEERLPDIKTYNRIDLMDEEDLFRLTTFKEDTIKHHSQIEDILRRIRDNREFDFGTKVLIYSSQVNTMLKIQEMCIKLELDSTLIHSMSHDRKMSNQTLERRKRILEEGIFEGDVLIINNSMETGINLKETNHFKYVIVNSSNIVEITQSRGRVRDDIQMLYTRLNYDNPLYFIDEHLDKELSKEEFIGLFSCCIDKNGDSWGIKKIQSELPKNGYKVDKKRKTVKGNKITIYKITK